MVLSRETKKDVERQLSALKRQVSLEVFTQDPESGICREARELAEGLAETSSRIQVEVNDFQGNGDLVRKYGIDKIPAIVVSARDTGLTYFFGAPSGFCFIAFIEAIKLAGAGNHPLSDETKAALKELKGEFRIEVFTGPTCALGIQMSAIASRFSVFSSEIHAETVSLVDFPWLAVKYGITSIPYTLVNEKMPIPGAISEKALLEVLAKCANTEKNPKRHGK
jgi:alkyl hydroperoxide reductase subunit AhpF